MKLAGLLFFLLLATLFFTFFSGVDVVKANGEIFIRADGSIDPPTASIATIDNVTYTLADNVYSGVSIERSNITFDGDGRVIQGAGVGTGIEIGSLERDEAVSGVTVKNLTVRGFERDRYGAGGGLDCGIFIFGSHNTVIECNVTDRLRVVGSNNNVTRCNALYGIEVIEMDGNNILENYVETGIVLHATSSNHIFRNRIAYGDFGIEGDFASSNNISENQIFHCRTGIAFYPRTPQHGYPQNPEGNIIVENEIIDCQVCGLSLDSAGNTYIYHNNIIGNGIQARTVTAYGPVVGHWDDGYLSGGNYWSDYNGTDADGDGIGDKPYSIDAANTDNYPLITRYNASAWKKLAFSPVVILSAAGEGVEFEFDASSSIPGWNGSQITRIDRYNWTFGDGSTETSALPKAVHAYLSAGLFEATVTVTDNAGMNGQGSQKVFVSMPTVLTVSTNPASTSLGLIIKISGTLKDFYGRGLQNQTVICYYTSLGLGWIPIVSCSTDQNGVYRIEWIPSATGAYTIMADFEGYFPIMDYPALYFRSESYANLSILSSENRYLFSVESNSSVSELLFNPTALELSFNVTGPQGSSGYSNVMMAKDPQGTNFDMKAYIDGEKLNYTSISSEDCWEISFSYPHSTHKIVMRLYPVQTSFLETLFGRALVLAISVFVIVFVIMLAIRRRKGNLRSGAVSEKRASDCG